ncbi:vWA domain-containing protein [Nocardioides caldifontis]|uniref:vWA domain-containing protein n=1 Tax=Nocardioides caldifontis TaxID=2588938 RepID=UPI0011E055FE|nr:VWA domain-containing protein [Nocardioides caldifontis]
MRRSGASLVAVLSLVLTVLVAPRAAAEEPPLRVMVVLDVSGSMGRDDGTGRTLLQGARTALGELVGSLPSDAVVGVRVYGSEYAGKDRSVSCRDTRLLVAPRRVDPTRIRRAADGLRPTGDTPIGLALRRAHADLGEQPASRRVIVLVSDGEDNCSPPDSPPCQVARDLTRSGVKVQVQTVGFALGGGGAARDALRCISTATAGQYYDARNADALSAALERISVESLGGLGSGTAVTGGQAQRNAPLLEPGAYRLRLRPGEATWFRFRAPEGSRPRVLATVEGQLALQVPAQNRRCPAWRVELYNPYGEGGSFPPYGNSGDFDGVGYGTTGASSAGRLSPRSLGIDYSGTWAVQLSLARDTADTCSDHLPEGRAYSARFSLSTGRGGQQPQESATPSPSASPAPEEEDTSAADKFRNPVEEGTPAWLYPVVAVGLLVLAALLAGGVLLLRRRRTRGW